MEVAARVEADRDAPPARRSSLSAFAHRDFRYLLVGTMGSNMGDWIQTVGQSWLVYELTGSATQLGVFAFVRGVAVLVVTPFGGAIADRTNRRNLLAVSTLIGALSAVALALLVATGAVRVWQLYVTGTIDGLVASVSQPARQVMVYDVVGADDLTNAIAINSMGSNLTRVVGPSLGGLLIGAFGVSWCFFGQALAYVIASGATFLIRTAGVPSGRVAPVFRSIGDGFRYSLQQRVVLLLLLVGMIPSLLVYPYLRFMAVFAENVFHAGASGYGVLYTGVAFGSIAGGAWIARHGTYRRSGAWMLAGNAVYMGFIGFFAISHQFLLGFLCLIVAGFANTIYNTLNQTLLQLNIDDDYRGRVLALYLTLSSITPVGSLAMGAMIDRWDAPSVIFVWCAAATAVILLVAAGSRRLRAL